MCILFKYTLLKVVCYIDMNVLSSIIVSDGFPKQIWMGIELYPDLFWIFGIILILQSP